VELNGWKDELVDEVGRRGNRAGQKADRSANSVDWRAAKAWKANSVTGSRLWKVCLGLGNEIAAVQSEESVAESALKAGH
jgi:hypothetical protein